MWSDDIMFVATLCTLFYRNTEKEKWNEMKAYKSHLLMAEVQAAVGLWRQQY